MPLVTIDKTLAATLLRDLADKIEAGEYELTNVDNTYYEPLHHGFVTVKYREIRG